MKALSVPVGAILTLLFLGMGLLIPFGCRTAPVTQRRQAMLVPESQELTMGRQAFQEVLNGETLSNNEHNNELVTRVGRRIAAAAKRPDYEWEFRVISSPEQNAFCLPGGKVGVYEGLLPLCESEADLAVVLSHEVAHALQRHGGERMSQEMIVKAGENALKYFTQNREEVLQQRVLTAYGVGAKYGALLPYSRTHELEADQVGLMLMAQAGYDPSVAPKFWERFAKQTGPKPPEFLSTHPADLRRASELGAKLPEAQALYAQAAEKYGLGEVLMASTPAPQPQVEPATRFTSGPTTSLQP